MTGQKVADWLTAKDLANRWGIGVSTARRWLSDFLPGERLGKRLLRVRRIDIERYEAQKKCGSGGLQRKATGPTGGLSGSTIADSGIAAQQILPLPIEPQTSPPTSPGRIRYTFPRTLNRKKRPAEL